MADLGERLGRIRSSALNLTETIEFHDALVVEFETAEADLRVRLERVSVYEGDRLVRQEGGVLRFEGVHDSEVDGHAALPQLELEYGSVLDWTLERGVCRFLIDWVGHAPSMHRLRDWTFRFRAGTWKAEFEHAD
jgi:hypothetical protein